MCFSEKCLLESDDCVVDVSDDNVVVLLTKDGKGIWDKFEAGLNISQTKVGWNCTILAAQESFPLFSDITGTV